MHLLTPSLSGHPLPVGVSRPASGLDGILSRLGFGRMAKTLTAEGHPLSTEASGRIRGAILGALVGDALGTPVEFSKRQNRVEDPVTGMRSGGRWAQPPGTWSDDGALLLASASSLLDGFDPAKMGQAFQRWYFNAEWSATGVVFDVGSTTRYAILDMARGIPPLQSGGQDVATNGNGSLMRILPVALRYHGSPAGDIFTTAVAASAITHAHARSCLACAAYCLIVDKVLAGGRLPAAIAEVREFLWTRPGIVREELALFDRSLSPGFGDTPVERIGSGGYVVETFEAALWSCLRTYDYESAVLCAVNLGGDADTTGCVAGGLAGAIYGETSIPASWKAVLPRS